MKLLLAYLGGFIAIVIFFTLLSFLQSDGSSGIISSIILSSFMIYFALGAMVVWAIIVTCVYFLYYKKKQLK